MKSECPEARSRSLTEALRLTVEYVGLDTLPAQEGWSWFDALKSEPWFPEWLSAMQGKAGVNLPQHLRAGSLVDMSFSSTREEYNQCDSYEHPWRVEFVGATVGGYLVRMVETEFDDESPLEMEFIISQDEPTQFVFFWKGAPYIIAGPSA